MSFRWSSAVLLSLLLPALAPADEAQAQTRQRPELLVERFDERQGLWTSVVLSATRDNAGFLWIGTPQGVYRFDGNRFEYLGQSVRDLPPYVHSLAADDRGGVIAGTEDHGLLHYDATGKVSVLPGPRTPITHLHRSRRGALWVATIVDSIFVRPDPNSIPRFVSRAPPGIYGFAEDEHGHVLVKTQDGIVALNEPRGSHASLRTARVDVAWASDSAMWRADSSGITRATPKGQSRTWSADELNLRSDVRLVAGRNGSMWAFEQSSGQVRFFHGSEFDWSSVYLGDAVSVMTSLATDDGILWLGTWGSGLIRIHPTDFINITRKDGLTTDIVMAIMMDRDSNLWVGSNRGVTIYEYSRAGTSKLVRSIPRGIIYTLHQMRDGRVLGGFHRGIWEFRGTSRERFLTGTRIDESAVRDILEDRAGHLWIATTNGLYRWDGRSARTFSQRSGLPSDFILTLHEDGNGVIWAGTREGLARIRGDSVTAYDKSAGLFAGSVLHIGEAAPQQLWIAGHGLATIDVITGTIKVWDLAPCAGEIGAVYTGRKGEMWLSTRSGLIGIDSSALRETTVTNCRHIGRGHGLPTLEMATGVNPAYAQLPDGRVAFGSARGLVTTDLTFNMTPGSPHTFITGIKANDRTIGRIASAGSKRLEFQFTTPNFVAPEMQLFRHRLRGYSDEWTTPSAQRTATYTDLKPKVYTFEVQAISPDGSTPAFATQAKVTVRPYFWQTWLFRLVVISAILVFVVIAYRVRVQHLRRRERQVAAMKTELAISQLQALRMQLQPHFLFNTLNSIASLIRRDADTAEGMVGNLSKLLRKTLEHRDVITHTLGQELELLEYYLSVERVRFRGWLVVKTHVDPVALDAQIPVMILQPLVENAIRHGIGSSTHGGTVTVSAKIVSDRVVISVEDDGAGFPQQTYTALGVGLGSAIDRLGRLYGDDHSFVIRSGKSGGTVVEIAIPVCLPELAEAAIGRDKNTFRTV